MPLLFSGTWACGDAMGLPLILTPAATFLPDVCIDGLPALKADSAFFLSPSRQCLWAWVDPMFEAELLVSEVQPALLDGMTVDGCAAAIWRLRAMKDLPDYAFHCLHDGSTLSEPGGPCSGQWLDAQEWRRDGVVLTLGTQDLEAMIAHRKRGGSFPDRLVRSIPDAEAAGTDVVPEMVTGNPLAGRWARKASRSLSGS